MSKNNSLEGWNGPLFPPGLNGLEEIYNEGGFSGEELETACRSIVAKDTEFRVLDGNKLTSSSYDWFFVAAFKIGGTEFAILIPPWAEDTTPGDGNLVRAIAVYTKGGPDQVKIQSVIKALTQTLETEFGERPTA